MKPKPREMSNLYSNIEQKNSANPGLELTRSYSLCPHEKAKLCKFCPDALKSLEWEMTMSPVTDCIVSLHIQRQTSQFLPKNGISAGLCLPWNLIVRSWALYKTLVWGVQRPVTAIILKFALYNNSMSEPRGSYRSYQSTVFNSHCRARPQRPSPDLDLKNELKLTKYEHLPLSIVGQFSN